MPSISAATTADRIGVGTNLSAHFADQLPHPTARASTSPRQDERAAIIDNLELPAFQPAPPPRFNWGLLDGDDFSHALSAAYAEVVHWRRNIFSVPSGAAGKAFVLELSRLIKAFAERSAQEAAAMKVIMVMPHLLLQKPHPSSISKDHQVCLERRLAVWKQGDIDALMRENRTIQHHLRTHPRKTNSHRTRSFAKMMMERKVNPALRLLADGEDGGILSLDQTVESGSSVR